ncbi:MAG: hypothetical protein BWY71_00964 [Planctomycetes bacterium ADurb.Bin412]|nr:MAG: hypothetical protein BWY71_00964 [Planctomycetes bacterium ADurb.Bin412]
MDIFKTAARHRQIARLAGPHGDTDGVEHLAEVAGGDILSDGDIGTELDPLLAKLLQPPVENFFVEFEVGDAVAEQAADAVVFFKYHDIMAHARQLLGGGQTGGTGADDGHPLAGFFQGRLGLDPALLPAVFDDLQLQLADGDGIFADVQGAGRLAGRRTNPAGNLGEIIGGMEQIEGLLPFAAIDQVVPVGDAIGQGTAEGMAGRHAAVHAAGGLVLQVLQRNGQFDFPVILYPFVKGPLGRFAAGEFHESGGLTHDTPPPWRKPFHCPDVLAASFAPALCDIPRA